MRNLAKRLIIGVQIGIGFIITIMIGLYLVNARSGTDSLTAGPGDKLTASKLNQILAKINSGGGSSSGINYDSTNNYNSFSGGILAGNSSTCDSTTKGELRTTSSALQICDGSSWSDLRSFAMGTIGNPAASCYTIKQNNPSSTDGLYYIKPASVVSQVWCDMTNGGRTLVARTTISQNYQVIDSLGSLTSPGQATTWKLSDADINTISKNTGYKFTCGSYTVTFSASCPFSSTAIANGYCLASPGVSASPRVGLSSYDQASAGAGKMIYARQGNPGQGCREGRGGTWANNGLLRVK